jgi:hypothetical protein
MAIGEAILDDWSARVRTTEYIDDVTIVVVRATGESNTFQSNGRKQNEAPA